MAGLALILTILGLLGPTLWNISGLRKEFRNPGDKRLSDRTVGEESPLSVEILMKSVLRENTCLLYTSPSPRDGLLSRMPSSA